MTSPGFVSYREPEIYLNDFHERAMRTESVFGLVSHIASAVLGAVFAYRGLKLSSQAMWIRCASIVLGVFLVVISLLLAVGLVH